ncbi:hypothetical protein AXG93_2446s1150 [Marchantia polymorpha subsp. ruderalis]|uniref:Uncharacterized protein n=1 Tax=Marchantia polymorpha subsp. ruderalis TaxID=1480154 RepID=A0A176W7S5_MARPO|nr:hypothetical protein AXG93_2446s1150 [Marchantia polymorpha subsp. ruderalis]
MSAVGLGLELNIWRDARSTAAAAEVVILVNRKPIYNICADGDGGGVMEGTGTCLQPAVKSQELVFRAGLCDHGRKASQLKARVAERGSWTKQIAVIISEAKHRARIAAAAAASSCPFSI